MLGLWDCARVDQLIDRPLRADLEMPFLRGGCCPRASPRSRSNRQRHARAFDIGEHHYDLGNELYQRMLDCRMTYPAPTGVTYGVDGGYISVR